MSTIKVDTIVDEDGSGAPNFTHGATGIAGLTPSIDDNGNATAITIDSSENVLVGTTTANSNNTGIGLTQDDVIYVTRSGGRPLLLNRQTSDGDIAEFRKDGSAVGSIGTSGGFFNIGSGDTGLLFVPSSDVIVPSNPTNTANGGRDAAINLGNVYNRFKDLYLSGGVYLGGTGAANKLDDYEEGNWTPVLKGDSGTPSGQVYGIQLGTYTKIGRSVHVQAYVSVTNMGSGVGGTYAQLHGLPFNIASGHQYFSSGSFPYVGALGQNVNSLHAYGQHGADYVYALYQNGAGVSSSYLSPAGWGSAPTIMFGMTYFTDA